MSSKNGVSPILIPWALHFCIGLLAIWANWNEKEAHQMAFMYVCVFTSKWIWVFLLDVSLILLATLIVKVCSCMPNAFGNTVGA
jgi:hypothetical protein